MPELTTSPSSGGDPAPAAMPEGLPTQFWDQQSGQVNMGELIKAHGEVAKFKADHDERIKTLPTRPDDYRIEIKLPDTVKLPDGMKPEINDKDPRIPAVRAFAHKHQLPQDAVTELVALHVQAQLAEYAAAEAEMQVEMKKLGGNGKARIDAVDAYISANFSKEEHAALRPFVGDAAAFGAIEKLIAKATAQSVPPNAGGGGNPPPQKQVRTADLFYGQKAGTQ